MEVTMENRIRDAEIRKNEIMQTALKLFLKQGYEKTSTNDIIRELGLSRGGLYHHFKSKEEILDSAISSLLLSELKNAEATFYDDKISAVEKVGYLIEFEAPAQEMYEDIMTIIHTKDNPTLITHLLRQKLQIVTPYFVRIIEQGVKEGVFECCYPQEVSKITVILSTLLFSDTILDMNYEEFLRMIGAFQIAIEALTGAKPGTFDFMKESIKEGR
jgi:AcrR family transcriptional regulator